MLSIGEKSKFPTSTFPKRYSCPSYEAQSRCTRGKYHFDFERGNVAWLVDLKSSWEWSMKMEFKNREFQTCRPSPKGTGSTCAGSHCRRRRLPKSIAIRYYLDSLKDSIEVRLVLVVTLLNLTILEEGGKNRDTSCDILFVI
jgi:hypothetical protein